jgi:hypothetical protein
MLKKNSWIIALLVALSLTAFFIIGCVSPLAVEEDTETYEEYPLDKGWNAWAGQVYQKGWAIGGIKFQGKGDKLETAKDLGYDIEMFQKATKLKIEMPDASYPRSGVDIIWGGEDASGDSTKGGGMWNQQPIAGGSGDIDTTFAKKDGNILIIDLTKALKNYSAYTKAAKLKIVMQVNAPSYGDVEGLVQKAYLMIPNTPPKFVGIVKNGVTLKEKTMYYTSPGFELAANIKGEEGKDATNQTVIWQLQGWSAIKDAVVPQLALTEIDLTDPANDALPGTPEYEASSLGQYEAAQKALFEKVRWLQEKYVIDDTLDPPKIGLKNVLNTLITPGQELSMGTVFLKATIKEAQKSGDTYKDYETILTLNIDKPLPFKYKFFANDGTTPLTPAENQTIYYGAVDNGGVSGGKLEGVKKAATDTFYIGYKITLGGGYGNSHHYVEIDLSGMGAGNDKFSNYDSIKAKYEAGDGDSNLVGKTVRLRASKTVPERSYWVGPFLSSVKYAASDGDGKKANLKFNLFKDDGDVYKDNADTPSVGGNMPNPQRYNGRDVEFGDDIKNASKLYIWIVPWSNGSSGGKATTFTITDIEFIHK